jgi:hypothetical protein
MQGRPRSLLIVTDAWHPQVNGVVRTIEKTIEELQALGVRVDLITPAEFRTVPMPGYGEIGLSITTRGPVVRRIEALAPEAIHIATEGPLGLIARNYCVKAKIPFSTAYHTQFPEYVRARLPVPLWGTYAMVRWFHGPAASCLTGTPFLEHMLIARGFSNVALWSKGVDATLFQPGRRRALPYKGPVSLYVGRIAVEKNVEAFLKLDLPGTKLVVGDGPNLRRLSAAYPDAVFLGARYGEDLATLFASADVFVFPSRTDTFGLVLLEALASGTPVAAYPVTGPIDVIGNAPVGVLHEDLRTAVLGALQVSREACRSFAEAHSWAASTRQFLDRQVLIGAPVAALEPSGQAPRPAV